MVWVAVFVVSMFLHVGYLCARQAPPAHKVYHRALGTLGLSGFATWSAAILIGDAGLAAAASATLFVSFVFGTLRAMRHHPIHALEGWFLLLSKDNGSR